MRNFKWSKVLKGRAYKSFEDTSNFLSASVDTSWPSLMLYQITPTCSAMGFIQYRSFSTATRSPFGELSNPSCTRWICFNYEDHYTSEASLPQASSWSAYILVSSSTISITSSRSFGFTFYHSNFTTVTLTHQLIYILTKPLTEKYSAAHQNIMTSSLF